MYSFGDYVPISALNHDGIDDLLECIKKYLPENNHLYPAELEEKEIPDNFLLASL
jgi:GTPase Era involved in 16S rRNA processing